MSDAQTLAMFTLVAIAFIYFVVYKKNKIFGNLGFMCVGALPIYYGKIAGADVWHRNVGAIVGILIIFGAIISLIYEFVPTKA